MKRLLTLCLMILIIPTFFACSNPIKQYETNEKSNYLTDETFKGGKDKDNTSIKKIWINDLIGDTKVIIDFEDTDKIPTHTIHYLKDKKEIKISFDNVNAESARISDYKHNKIIKKISVKNKNNNKSEISVKLNKSIKYRTDETIDSSQLVINLR